MPDRRRWGILAVLVAIVCSTPSYQNLPTRDMAYVDEASDYVSFLYLTDDVERLSDPNPYNTLPRYFEELLNILEPSV